MALPNQVICQTCQAVCTKKTETKKFGRKTMEREVFYCPNCKSPMDNSPKAVQIGNWR